jgi:hypothetical protein
MTLLRYSIFNSTTLLRTGDSGRSGFLFYARSIALILIISASCTGTPIKINKVMDRLSHGLDIKQISWVRKILLSTYSDVQCLFRMLVVAASTVYIGTYIKFMYIGTVKVQFTEDKMPSVNDISSSTLPTTRRD